MKTIFESETLKSTTSTGEEKYWRTRVLEDEDGACYTQSESWQVRAKGGESKHITSTPYRAEPKNVGKANETTPRDQARSEAESEFAKKMKKGGYWLASGPKPVSDRMLPMLAHVYEDKAHVFEWDGAVAQPKLDGQRMLMRCDGKSAPDAWTRGGEDQVAECVAHLACDTGGYVLDGELLLPPIGTPLQDTSAAAKKYRKDVSETLQFHVYDIVLPGVPYAERRAVLGKVLAGITNPNVLAVETRHVKSYEEAEQLHDEWVAQGYEGAMLRAAALPYTPKDRNAGLLKLKRWVREEFPIVAVKQGGGKAEGTAIFVCKTKDGETFDVSPQGTVEQRRAYYEQRDALVGKMLTVEFQAYSKNGVPRILTGISIREEGE